MPITGFICPDKEKCHRDACLSKCRLGERCVTIPTLHKMSQNRPWTGIPSTTECIRGTREAFLLRTKDYYIDPQNRAFALLGTRHHTTLEKVGEKLDSVITEERFTGLRDEVTGISDLLTPTEEDPDWYEVIDYKTWGSYPIMKALGNYTETVFTGGVYKSGPRKGEERTKKEVRHDPTKADYGDAYLQLNRYRIFFEAAGFPVARMKVQATVRDGGTYMAFNRGCKLNIYMFEVPRMPDDVCLGFFDTKSRALVDAITNNRMPPVCDEEESWEGRKCEKYCDAWEFCERGVAAHARALEKEDR